VCGAVTLVVRLAAPERAEGDVIPANPEGTGDVRAVRALLRDRVVDEAPAELGVVRRANAAASRSGADCTSWVIPSRVGMSVDGDFGEFSHELVEGPPFEAGIARARQPNRRGHEYMRMMLLSMDVQGYHAEGATFVHIDLHAGTATWTEVWGGVVTARRTKRLPR
jgi:hypothetical protein